MSKTKYEFMNELKCDDKRKRLAGAILDGAYFHREKENRKGIRTVKFGGKINQRVDTYDGRIKVASEILGLKYQQIEKLYGEVLEKNSYLSKNKGAKSKIENFISESKNLEGITSSTNDIPSESEPEIVDNKPKRNFIYNVIRNGVTVGLIGATLLYGSNFKNLNARAAQEKISTTICEKHKESNESLEIKICKPENSKEPICTNCNTSSLTLEPMVEDKTKSAQNYLILEPIIIEKNVKSQTPNDLTKYLNHVIIRNPQIEKNDTDLEISISPERLVNQIGKNYNSVKEDIQNISNDVGFNKEKETKRINNIKSGFEKAGKGILKFLTFGNIDLNDKKVQKREGNQLVRWLKSPFDVVLGTAKGIVSTVDLPLAGIPGKSLEILTDTFKGTVNSTVNIVDYPVATLLKGAGSLENSIFKNNGKISDNTYLGLSTITRFSGNVLNHEAATSGKEIKYNEAMLDKGNTGAALEQIGSIILDYNVLKKDKSKDSDSPVDPIEELLPEEEFDWGSGNPRGG